MRVPLLSSRHRVLIVKTIVARTIKYQAKPAATAEQGDVKKKKLLLFLYQNNLSTRTTRSKRRGKSCFEMSETAIWWRGLTGWQWTLCLWRVTTVTVVVILAA